MNEHDDRDDSLITGAHTARLLRFAFGGAQRPVDDLIRRLDQEDGAAWFRGLFRAGPLAALGGEPALLEEGRATLDDLERLKSEGKRAFRRAQARGDADALLGGLAAYFLASAAALAHHGRMIGSQSRDELDEVLLDLASATPEPWTGFLAAATRR